ncbi:MAG TPA: Rieske 2Fe-2S domain-containing protein, partial [Polyangiaceae bacterium]|nr:Rieske 2Fe-2S domain-containing protein [Polyangiaceae bacterium]
MNRLPMAPRGVAPGWYPLCLERELGRRPRRYVLGGLPLVAARMGSGCVVLLDRCPHRNVPLSRGRIRGEALQCPYHGWQFDRDGHCVLIPGRGEPPKASHAVASYPTRTHHGILFVGLDVAPESAPFSSSEQSDPGYVRLVRAVTLPGSPLMVVENALDVPHTGVLHGGLFRTAQRRAVQVVCRRYSSFIEAEYVGERAPGGLLARLLRGGRDGEARVVHFDRFFLPGVLQVEYRLGEKAHLLITGYVKPID